MANELIQMRNITKTFGKVQALGNVSLTVNKSEIVGLVGDNGAGKSTLIKILSGALRADSGEIYFKGEPVKIENTQEAIKMRIETIYQDSALVDQLSVARNLFLGREPRKRFGLINKLDIDFMRSEATKLLHQIGLKNINPDAFINELSGGERQSIAIARAMFFEADLIILDEPTNNLGIEESQSVLEFVVEAKRNGHSSIFITHNIHHIYKITDRIVVLRRGKNVGDVRRDETTIDDISKLIIGLINSKNT